MRPTPTHCPYCALRCGTSGDGRDRPVAPGRGGAPAGRARRRAAVRLGPADGSAHSGAPGRPPGAPAGPAHAAAPGRAPLRPVSWAAALDRIAAEVGRTQRAAGFDAVAV